ncbi:MsnO8 family LLM class oxidoreductase [Catenuloplanes japonicus]|uniref:MsnO8 family LLM class oxidoreductase n=1 Tax=Catenuloplanes japonicus TaxID=33876 RepID=UPI00069239B6|nr:MsnO8 family LLM class oxidoreductase [Catenuloplanes japonicus]
MTIPLSALELAPTEDGGTTAAALDAAVQTVRRLDELGYRRAWFAEHHGSAFFASVVPSILIAHLAAQTGRIRLGSGGVLIPNHAPIAIAEQFATLAALHPGRIDLGMGRGAGARDDTHARALRRGADPATDADYRSDLAALLAYLSGESGTTLIAGRPSDTDRPSHDGQPSDHDRPPRTGPAPWLLATSPASAELAARLGLPVVLGHQIRPDNTVASARRYRELFTPSRFSDRPYIMVALEAIVADTDEEAARLARPIDMAKIGLFSGEPDAPLPTPAQAESFQVPPELAGPIAGHTGAQSRGSVATVTRQFAEIIAQTSADELMLTTAVYDPADRIRSFELAAKAAAQL